MSRALKSQLAEDKALRDAALALIKTDVENLKSDMSAKNIGSRIADRMKESAQDTAKLANENKGILAGLLALTAASAWFARNPILAFLCGASDDQSDEGAEIGAVEEDNREGEAGE